MRPRLQARLNAAEAEAGEKAEAHATEVDSLKQEVAELRRLNEASHAEKALVEESLEAAKAQLTEAEAARDAPARGARVRTRERQAGARRREPGHH